VQSANVKFDYLNYMQAADEEKQSMTDIEADKARVVANAELKVVKRL
jgi:hypothetical protein